MGEREEMRDRGQEKRGERQEGVKAVESKIKRVGDDGEEDRK